MSLSLVWSNRFAVRLDSRKRRRNATETAGDTWNDEREPRCFFYLIPHSSSLSLICERKDEVKAVGTPRMWWAMKGASSSNSMVLLRRGGLRLIADKASNRSAVHGTRIPVPDVVDVSCFSLWFHRFFNDSSVITYNSFSLMVFRRRSRWKWRLREARMRRRRRGKRWRMQSTTNSKTGKWFHLSPVQTHPDSFPDADKHFGFYGCNHTVKTSSKSWNFTPHFSPPSVLQYNSETWSFSVYILQDN